MHTLLILHHIGTGKHIIEAYSKSVQGFFTKPDSFSELARLIKNIIEYWKDRKSPVQWIAIKIENQRLP